MVSWGKVANNVANSVQWAASMLHAGSGKVASAANNVALFGNTTPSAFDNAKMVVGIFGVTKAEMANTTGEGKKTHAPGWSVRRAFLGPIKSVTAVGGTGIGNGETVIVSGGTINATLTLTTNATGNAVSAAVTSAGQFPNTSVLVYTWQRQQHLVKLTVSGGSSAYNNTDYIVVGNGSVNAYLTVTTNATGFIVNTALATSLAASANVGLWSNTFANTNVSVTVFAANGAATNGAGATFVANLATSTINATFTPVLGGRAGRVTYESLAVVKGMINGNSTVILPS